MTVGTQIARVCVRVVLDPPPPRVAITVDVLRCQLCERGVLDGHVLRSVAVSGSRSVKLLVDGCC